MITQPSRPPMKILLAVDGSEHSRAAAQFIRNFPLPPGSETAIEAVFVEGEAPEEFALLTALDESHALLLNENLDIRTGLLHGEPATELTRFADEYQPDLMVVGAKGLRATLGILLGGVAHQVVEYARWPVLVVRAPYQGLQRILLVTDGSPPSQHAGYCLGHFPLPSGVAVSVMHVLPSRPVPAFALAGWPMGPEMAPPSPEALRAAEEAATRQAEAEEKEGQALLDHTIEALKSAGIEAAPVLVRGDAATEIIQHSKVHDVDLIVSGSRGLGQVAGWLLGSVSRKLVHEAGCSVLVVKGETAQQR